MANRERVGLLGFLWRFGVALVVVLGAYNPSGYSYYHWVFNNLFAEFTIYQGFVGICLLIGWSLYLREAYLALGKVGLVLAVAFFGTLLWMVVKSGLVSPDSPKALAYLVLVGVAAVMAFGATWGHLRLAFSGQRTTDDVDN